MSQARTNARRRKQATQKFSHLAPRQRPNYKMRDAETSARHNARLLATERRMAAGKNKR